jgi:glycosyltransferase involved in cell wall biosynthesis
MTPWNRWLYRCSDRLVFANRSMAEPFERIVPVGRVAVVYGGTDARRFDPAHLLPKAEARRSLGLPVNAFVAGVVARFSPVKGHRFVLPALARLASEGRDAHLVLAGENAQLEASALRTDADERGIASRVHLFGRVPDVREVIAALDVGVVASTGSEAVCRVAGEYMACARPVVATRVGVLPEMVADGETGMLVAPEDPDAIARALALLQERPDLGRSMGARGRARVESEFSLDEARRRYGVIYAAARNERERSRAHAVRVPGIS